MQAVKTAVGFSFMTLPPRRRAHFVAALVERRVGSANSARLIDLLKSETSEVRNHRSAPAVFQVEQRAFARRKRIQVRNTQREIADRASFNLHVDGLLRRALQCFLDDHVDDGGDEAIAEVVVAPGRCDGRYMTDNDLLGATRALAVRNITLCLCGRLEEARQRAADQHRCPGTYS